MYHYLIDQAQAKQTRIWAEIDQDRLIDEAKKAQVSNYFETEQGNTKMKAIVSPTLATLLWLVLLVAGLTAASYPLPATAHGPKTDPAAEVAPTDEHEHNHAHPVNQKACFKYDPYLCYNFPQNTQSEMIEAKVSPLLGNLGDYHYPITTGSELAQRYFNQGLMLAYGFNHQLAIQSFEDALKLDPACAMCYWGIAYALGPNINAPMEDAAVPQAFAAIQKAQKLAPRASAVEQALIDALAQRYTAEPVEDRSGLDKAYADAMREAVRHYRK